MNFKTQNAKNLISKDNELSKNTARVIIDKCDIETFKTLCENCEHIFDFIKDKIVKNLGDAVNHNNIENTFKFCKIYDFELGEFIINSWLRYANEDLTDKLLEILENGTEEEKIYAVKYFKKINDPLALEYLNKFALSDNEFLAEQSAAALSAYKDNVLRDTVIKSLFDETDEFKKIKYIKFLINYACSEDLSLIFDALDNSPFAANIASALMYKHNADDFAYENKLKIYDEIINAYPEYIELCTVYDFNIYDFLKELMQKSDDSYAHRILADTKNIFGLICSDNIYTYDLDKNCVAEIKKINNIFESFSPDAKIITRELDFSLKRVLRALDAICRIDKNSEAKDKIINLCNKTDNPIVLCQCAKTAKTLGFCEDLNKDTLLEKITDTNAKALFESYFI